MNVAMTIQSWFQLPNDVAVDQIPFFGTEREAFESIKLVAKRIARDIENGDGAKCVVEMTDSLYAQIWTNNTIVAYVEAVPE